MKNELESVNALGAFLSDKGLSKKAESAKDLPENCGSEKSVPEKSWQEKVRLCDDPHAAAFFHIQRDGHWHYLGSPLPNKFSKLFSRILYCFDGEHFLITPVEKLRVSVEKVPLIIVAYEDGAAGFTLVTSLGTEHDGIQKEDVSLTEEGVYFPLERGLTACLNRACYYRYINEFII
jgi:hypothetical protein